MKKLFLSLLLPLLIITACDLNSNDDSDEDLTTVPDAEAEDDGKASGVYKGVIAGADSSGSFMIDINNTASGRALGDTYTATVKLEINNSSGTFTGTATEQADGSLDVLISFTLNSGAYIITANIDFVGNITDIIITENGVEMEVAAHKEESDFLLEVWRGSFTGDASGKWNFIYEDDEIAGIYFSDDGDSGTFEGTVANSVISPSGGDVDASGTILEDSETVEDGTWDAGNGDIGTWTGARVL